MKKKRILIIGGAGFIGINTADYFLSKEYTVTILDNLSRKGTKDNLLWLKERWNDKLSFLKVDIVKNPIAVAKAAQACDAIIHLAGQVAVTSSVEDPYHDFLSNALGTLHVLEAIRKSPTKPMILYSSTNKVYGGMEQIKLKLTKEGYLYRDLPRGISETALLDFHSPYGCSKGAADQYVRDYARIYGLDTVVFRQSCIYGPRQFGHEDQGWIAWFAIRAALGQPVTVYGDGHQTRDVLYVEDLCRLYEMAIQNPMKVSGKIYNVGGGYRNVLSVLQTLKTLEKNLNIKMKYSFSDWRPGDQKVYISDISLIKKELGWEPQVNVTQGLKNLIAWVDKNKHLFR